MPFASSPLTVRYHRSRAQESTLQNALERHSVYLNLHNHACNTSYGAEPLPPAEALHFAVLLNAKV